VTTPMHKISYTLSAINICQGWSPGRWPGLSWSIAPDFALN